MKRTEKATKTRMAKLAKQWEERLSRMGLGMEEERHYISYIGLLTDIDRAIMPIAPAPRALDMDPDVAAAYREDVQRKVSIPTFTSREEAPNGTYYISGPALLARTELRLRKQAPAPYEPHPGNRLGRHVQELSRDGDGLADRLRLRMAAEGGSL